MEVLEILHSHAIRFQIIVIRHTQPILEQFPLISIFDFSSCPSSHDGIVQSLN